MSTVIPLRFKSHYDPELLSEGVKFNLIRLLADVDFKTLDGWSPKYQAIIDTGSPANIIPQYIWSQSINRLILTKKFSLGGIGEGKVFRYLGEITARVSYRAKSTKSLKLRAFLLETDSVPLILGFEDFLTMSTLLSSYPKSLASVKF
jgi:hypothetical protein